nr:ribonuclease H-like domain-containing protein [Tanacetum cinerariifolium]
MKISSAKRKRVSVQTGESDDDLVAGEESSQPPQPPITSTEAPQMVSSVKLLILKKDAKTLWAAIKTKFGGNAESKLMQKNVLKQKFEIVSVSNSEGLDKGYDRFQRLLSLLEIHRAGSSGSSSNLQNVAFVSIESTISTNKLNASYSVSTAIGHSSQAQGNRSRDAGNAGYRRRDNGKRPEKEEDEQALLVQDGLGTYD